jgi:hypothetical protein
MGQTFRWVSITINVVSGFGLSGWGCDSRSALDKHSMVLKETRVGLDSSRPECVATQDALLALLDDAAAEGEDIQVNLDNQSDGFW